MQVAGLRFGSGAHSRDTNKVRPTLLFEAGEGTGASGGGALESNTGWEKKTLFFVWGRGGGGKVEGE